MFVKNLIIFFSLVYLGNFTRFKDRQNFKTTDFVFDLFSTLNSDVIEKTKGGEVRSLFGDNFPLLKQIKMSTTHFKIFPCATNSPHYHPFGSEIVTVLKGNLEVGISEENGGRFMLNSLSTGHIAIIPQGIMLCILFLDGLL